MRLTLDTISQAPQCINPTKDRSISFRGGRIPVIENLGTTKDHFDCIDLCENDLIKLDNFPPLKRLRTLLVANNRVTRISDDFCECLPALKSLILTNNKLEQLNDLRPLAKGSNLERLSLVGNPVTFSSQHYRSFVIHIVPSLRFIDFQRVTQKERLAAKQMFAGEEGETFLRKIAPGRSTVSKHRVSGTDEGKEGKSAAGLTTIRRALGGEGVGDGEFITESEIEQIKTAIARATTFEEVNRLEKVLQSGVIPADVLADMASEDARVHPEDIGAPPVPPPPRPPSTASSGISALPAARRTDDLPYDRRPFGGGAVPPPPPAPPTGLTFPIATPLPPPLPLQQPPHAMAPAPPLSHPGANFATASMPRQDEDAEMEVDDNPQEVLGHIPPSEVGTSSSGEHMDSSQMVDSDRAAVASISLAETSQVEVVQHTDRPLVDASVEVSSDTNEDVEMDE